MNDYLESMLEEETEEEEGVELSPLVFWKKRQKEREPESSASRKEDRQRDISEEMWEEISLGMAWETVPQEKKEMESLVIEASELNWHGLSASRSSAGAWLYGVWRQRRESLRVVSQSGKDTISVTLPERAAGESIFLSAESLDRLVERDARRYDSGFSLY